MVTHQSYYKSESTKPEWTLVQISNTSTEMNKYDIDDDYRLIIWVKNQNQRTPNMMVIFPLIMVQRQLW